MDLSRLGRRIPVAGQAAWAVCSPRRSTTGPAEAAAVTTWPTEYGYCVDARGSSGASPWAYATRPEDEHGRGVTIISALVDGGGSHRTSEELIDHWADLAAA
ncbi:hypothetical protein ACFV06_01660 [Streptomyces sp. NPDC059618]|uniref:hypothetical protein n=1 Tax=Streptomyces sp. NPDC059618 TaxID=3346887 RepID=UPI0036BC55E3